MALAQPNVPQPVDYAGLVVNLPLDATKYRLLNLLTTALNDAARAIPQAVCHLRLTTHNANTVAISVGGDNVSGTNYGYQLNVDVATEAGLTTYTYTTQSLNGVPLSELYVYANGAANQKIAVEFYRY